MQYTKTQMLRPQTTQEIAERLRIMDEHTRQKRLAKPEEVEVADPELKKKLDAIIPEYLKMKTENDQIEQQIKGGL